VVSIIQQRTWTNKKARNHVSSLHSLLVQLYALETHIRISKNLKKFVHLMRNHRSGPELSPCPLHAQASGPNISGNLIVRCNGSARLLQDTLIGFHYYWRQLSAYSSIVARRTANSTSFLCCVVGSASLLSAAAIFWRLAMSKSFCRMSTCWLFKCGGTCGFRYFETRAAVVDHARTQTEAACPL